MGISPKIILEQTHEINELGLFMKKNDIKPTQNNYKERSIQHLKKKNLCCLARQPYQPNGDDHDHMSQ